MRGDLLVAVGLAACATLASARADAFCRTRTVAPGPGVIASGGCFEEGLPLFHPSKCITYRLLERESSVLSNTAIATSMARAFAVWTAPNAACAPGISAVELAPVSDATVASYTTGQRGHNVVGVVSPWPHPDAQHTLALSTVTFNAQTGEIYDVDLELPPDVAWSTSPAPGESAIDLDSVVTHEVGHMLGLTHTAEVEAVMYAHHDPGSVAQRTLHADDAAGICAVYPDRETRSTGAGNVASTTCDLAPGATPDATGSTCQPLVSHGCAAADARASTGASAALLASLVALAVARRRRTPRPRGQ